MRHRLVMRSQRAFLGLPDKCVPFDTVHRVPFLKTRVRLSPGCRSVGLCRALSGLCRGSVGTLSGLCRLTTVGPLSASVGLCRPLSADPDSDYALNLSTSVGLSRLCRSVGLSVCRPLSVSVDELSGLSRALNALFE